MDKEAVYCPQCGTPAHKIRVCEKCGYEFYPIGTDIAPDADATVVIAPASAAPPTSTTPQSLNAPLPASQLQGMQAPRLNTMSDIWPQAEPIVSFIGEWAWVFVLLACLVEFIIGIVGASLAGIAADNGIDIDFAAGWEIAWQFIGAAIGVILVFVYIRRFSGDVKAKSWQKLCDDVVFLGNYRIPKMLVVGVILEFILSGWGGLFVLAPALLIALAAPVQMKWSN